MTESSLVKMLNHLIKNHEREQSVLEIDESPIYENYWFAKTGWRLKMFAYGTIAGMGKQKSPMLDVDPHLAVLLNRQKYFSSSVGLIWEKQAERIYEDISVNEQSTLLFADAYNIMNAKFRARLWTINFMPLGNGFTDIYVTFGHCGVMPMLPYEILGVATIVFDFARISNQDINRIVWYFHSLDARVITEDIVEKYEPFEILSEPPTPVVSKQMLSAEKQLRNTPYVRPDLEIPVDMYSKDFIDNLTIWYREKGNAESRLDKLFQ